MHGHNTCRQAHNFQIPPSNAIIATTFYFIMQLPNKIREIHSKLKFKFSVREHFQIEAEMRGRVCMFNLKCM